MGAGRSERQCGQRDGGPKTLRRPVKGPAIYVISRVISPAASRATVACGK